MTAPMTREELADELERCVPSPGGYVLVGADERDAVVAALRAGIAQQPVSEEERHAIGHARHQVERAKASLVNSECCFDYQLVADLLRVIDRSVVSSTSQGCGDPRCKDPNCAYGKGPNRDPLSTLSSKDRGAE